MDIYRRQTPPQRSLPNTALYISLFPQLVAGPIIRYKDIASQITHRIVGVERFAQGVNRFIIGLGKKVLIANVVGLPADKIFAIPSEHLTTPVAWLGIVCYTLQIYFDFSGYSDMVAPAEANAFHFIAGRLLPLLFVAAAGLGLWQGREHLAPPLVPLLLGSFACLAVSGVMIDADIPAFWPQTLGHLLKALGYCLSCRAVVVTGIRRPYALLFKEIDRRERELTSRMMMRSPSSFSSSSSTRTAVPKPMTDL